MADFPALRPAARKYSLGGFPVTTEADSGGSVRFLHGTAAFGHTLDLDFPGLTETQATLIREHYRTQNGGYIPFALSTQAWAGHASMTDLVPSTTLWKYAQAPDETHHPRGIVDVQVRLRSVI